MSRRTAVTLALVIVVVALVMLMPGTSSDDPPAFTVDAARPAAPPLSGVGTTRDAAASGTPATEAVLREELTRVPDEVQTILRVVDAESRPAPGLPVGIAADESESVEWIGTTDGRGEWLLASDVLQAVRAAPWIVVQASTHAWLRAEPAPLLTEGAEHVLTLPETEATTVVVVGLDPEEEASVWCGRSESAPVSVPLFGQPEWHVVHMPAVVRTNLGRVDLLVPERAGYAVKATATRGSMQPLSHEQPFAREMRFVRVDDDTAPSRLGVRIVDRAGQTADVAGTVWLRSGSNWLRATIAGGRLDVAAGPSLSASEREAAIRVIDGEGERWAPALSDARPVKGGMEVTLTKGRGVGGLVMRAPRWVVDRVYLVLKDGAVRAVTPYHRAHDSPRFWMRRGREVIVGGVSDECSAIWLLSSAGAAFAAPYPLIDPRAGYELPQLGDRLLRSSDVWEQVGGRRAVITYEVQLPGQTVDHWIQLDSASWTRVRDARWLKGTPAGLRGRFRAVARGEERILASW